MIPGRIALPYGALTFSGNFQEFLKSLGPLMEDGKQPERIVCPFDRETAMIGILIYLMKSQAVAYNWTYDATLGDDILKMYSLVVSILRETVGLFPMPL